MHLNLPQDLDRVAVSSILEKLREFSGVDFSEYRESTIHRRLTRRMSATDTNEWDYLKLLSTDPRECGNLMRELTIKYSEFYRDPPLWEFLQTTLLPEMLRGRKTALRVWSAGCAQGEEPYTIAMALDSLRETLPGPFDFDITATDLDECAIESARQGDYHLSVIGQLPDEYASKYICAGKTAQVSDYVKSMVTFCQDNLCSPASKDAPQGPFDLVFCRNVLIYLKKPLQNRVFDKLICSVAPGGILILGTAETMPKLYESRLRELNRPLKIYQLLN